MILFYYIYNNCKNIHSKINNGKNNRDTVVVVKRVFPLAKTIVVDVSVIYITRIPVVFFVIYLTCVFQFVKKSNYFK